MKQIKKEAFTLIEVIVVLIILGILASLAVTSYFSWINNARNTVQIFDEHKSMKDILLACIKSHPGQEAICYIGTDLQVGSGVGQGVTNLFFSCTVSSMDGNLNCIGISSSSQIRVTGQTCYYNGTTCQRAPGNIYLRYEYLDPTNPLNPPLGRLHWSVKGDDSERYCRGDGVVQVSGC